MGDVCYMTDVKQEEGAHVYAHSRKDGKEGYCYLVINNSLTDETVVSLPKDATVYTLNGNGNIRSKVMYLNGKPLVLNEDNSCPALEGEQVSKGEYVIPAGSCSFIVI